MSQIQKRLDELAYAVKEAGGAFTTEQLGNMPLGKVLAMIQPYGLDLRTSIPNTDPPTLVISDNELHVTILELHTENVDAVIEVSMLQDGRYVASLKSKDHTAQLGIPSIDHSHIAKVAAYWGKALDVKVVDPFAKPPRSRLGRKWLMDWLDVDGERFDKSIELARKIDGSSNPKIFKMMVLTGALVKLGKGEMTREQVDAKMAWARGLIQALDRTCTILNVDVDDVFGRIFTEDDFESYLADKLVKPKAMEWGVSEEEVDEFLDTFMKRTKENV